jgi:uncharacterized protein (TIGR02453 family)
MGSNGTGFGDAALDFYEGLAADNSRTYWQLHKDVYEGAIAEPMRALAAALEPEFGTPRIFRPYRDLRFSADKRPYQEHASMGVEGARGSGYYLSLSREGLMLAGGNHQPAKDQLERFRTLQDDDAATADLDATLASLLERGFVLSEGSPVKTAPRGWSRDHPRLELIRRTSLVVVRHYEPGDWLFDERCLGVVTEGWRAVGTWNAWLDARIGASTLPAPARGR